MIDLEDVLSDLYRFKESLENSVKFIDKLIKLFGSWDSAVDMGCEQETTMNDIFERINDVLIKGD
ncbi:hypothetical protein LCGC14_1211560 [marine sediment metagenome]|uniref:Uncharacterized protein n=1 Tax=marine sediment metagenome TaxID=412755 RepID=A0A0F9LDS3_9ZZZZ